MARSRTSSVRSNVEQLESRDLPSSPPIVSQNFDLTAIGAVPNDWSRWSSDGHSGFGVSSTRAVEGLGITSAGTSARASRTWDNLTLPSDVQASASIYADSLIPAEVIVRGSHLDTATPTYYAVSVTRGTAVSLLRVQNGVSTPIASLTTNLYISALWLRISLTVEGNHLQATVQRADTSDG